MRWTGGVSCPIHLLLGICSCRELERTQHHYCVYTARHVLRRQYNGAELPVTCLPPPDSWQHKYRRTHEHLESIMLMSRFVYIMHNINNMMAAVSSRPRIGLIRLTLVDKYYRLYVPRVLYVIITDTREREHILPL